MRFVFTIVLSPHRKFSKIFDNASVAYKDIQYFVKFNFTMSPKTQCDVYSFSIRIFRILAINIVYIFKILCYAF